jgi:FtsP/CotA-like multicopper oxidase with cupredoxin domain
VNLAYTGLPYFAAAMSRNQRIGLLIGALLVAVVAFIIARPSDDDNDSSSSSSTTTTESQAPADDGGTTTQSQAPPEPKVTRIQTKDGVLVGDPQTIRAEKNETVQIVVTSTIPDEMHLHGYDIEKEAGPGKPARFKFKANVEGAFELESHAAEDAGEEPLLARLFVGPQ